MSDSEATGRIRITKVPDGEAPLAVRRAWIGLVLPCHPFYGCQGGDEKGVLSGEEATQSRLAFTVPQPEALDLLAASNPMAAEWWKSHGFPKPSQYFSFGRDEVEIVRGVRQQEIFLAEDGCDGDPYR